MQSNDLLSSPKARGKRLRLLRKMSGLTLAQLAEKYALGVSTIKYWECAKNEGLSTKGAKKVIMAMQHEGIQCSFMWLIHGVGTPPQFVDVHYNNKSISNIIVPEDNAVVLDEEKSIADEISLFCDKVPDAITLSILDDGMEPLYSLGDSVGGKRLFGEDLAKAIGKDCIVETATKQLLCRKLGRGNELQCFNLYCINPHTIASPPHVYDVQILSAAPISRIWKRLW